MRKTIFALAIAALPAAANAQNGFRFTDEVRLACPDVSDQQYSGTCWCFSSLSFMESEMMFFGNENPPNLSEMFIVRQNYVDRADKHVMLHGKMNFGQGSYFLDNFIIAREHGLAPESAMPNIREGEYRLNHSKLESEATRFVDSVADDNKKSIDPAWRGQFAEILDKYIAPAPESFEYQGKTYTPRSFADEVVRLNFDDYVQVTSFSHHPFYENFILEIPDNWRWGQFFNVKVDDLITIMDAALDKGHTVLWASDVSENGFSTRDGFAILPGLPLPEDPRESGKKLSKSALKAAVAKYENELSVIENFKALEPMAQRKKAKNVSGPVEEIKVTQETRQMDFLSRSTTDDHGMHIVGRAHDQYGSKFYIVKNSWGVTGAYKGYFYVSESFVKAKSTGILVHKSALDGFQGRQ